MRSNNRKSEVKVLSALLFFFCVSAQAQVTHFLAVLVDRGEPMLAATSAGSVIPFNSEAECQEVARKANFEERYQLKAANAEYICLKIERVSV